MAEKARLAAQAEAAQQLSKQKLAIKLETKKANLEIKYPRGGQDTLSDRLKLIKK